MQCIVILGLLPKDTRPYPNTLLIWSLSEVNFWVFLPRDLTPFLIRPLWCHFISFSFLFFSFSPSPGSFILISISHNHFFNLSFSSHNHDAYEVQSHHISTSIIFYDIILFTPIMSHNFQ